MKAIISVLGGDKPGIIAEISGCLYRYNVNILDITQTILSGYFNMVMMVDLSGMTCPFDGMTGELTRLGEKLGLEIRMQRNEIFDAMHRL